MKETVEIPLQSRMAAVGTIDKENRTAELVWTTGAAVKRMDWRSGQVYLEELSLDSKSVRMDRLNSGAPLLNSHQSSDLSSVVGVVDKASISDGEGRATVRFSRRADVEPFWNDVQDGIIRNVSVGYAVHKFDDVTSKGEKMKRLMAVDWEPMELSLVPIGADAGAGVRSNDAKNSCEIEFSEREQDSEAALPGPPADSLTAVRERSGFMFRNPR